ncbi:hypothetical protein D9M68_46940 [compost metagenome]
MPIHPGACAAQSKAYQAGELVGYQFAIKLSKTGQSISLRTEGLRYALFAVSLIKQVEKYR